MKEIFSIYPIITVTKPEGTISLYEFVRTVQRPSKEFVQRISAARKLLKDGDAEGYKKAKSGFKYVTPWGVFSERNGKSLQSASGIMVIDIDGHDQEKSRSVDDWEELRDQLEETGRFAAGFLSPSADGLKLFVRVAPKATAKAVMKQVVDYLAEGYGLTVDPSGKDISRACYVSWDPHAFYKDESTEWEGAEEEKTVYHLDQSKSVFAKTEATAEETAEDEDARFTRYLNQLQGEGRLDYADWQQVIEACVGQWGEQKAVAEMVSRWPDEKPGETAYKASKANPCSNPHGSLWMVLERHGLAHQTRKENREQKIREIQAAKKADRKQRKEPFVSSDSKSADAEEAERLKKARLRTMAEDPRNYTRWDGLSGDTRELQDAAIVANTQDIYYDGPNRYLFETRDGFIAKGAGDMKELLKKRGFRATPQNGEAVSEVNDALMYVQAERYVSYAGPLAGKMRGLYTVNTKHILATSSPELIEPAEGECPLLDELVDGLFLDGTAEGEHQKRFFFGWLKTAYESLKAGVYRSGQALVLAGQANCGKTLLKSVIVRLLGNRAANPFPYMTGMSRFNSDLAGAECLCIDDATGSTDTKTRKTVAAKLKEMLFSKSISIENKGREPFQFEPFWRMIFCVNEDPESLLVMPILSEDVDDKIALLQCKKWVTSLPNQTIEERQAFDAQLAAELPAFLDKVLKFEIPKAEQESRCGVAVFQHSGLVEKMKAVAPEEEFLMLIDELGQTDLTIYDQSRTARDWERLLIEAGSHYANEVKRLCSWTRASGIIMMKLANKKVLVPAAVHEGRSKAGNKYRILSPEKREQLRVVAQREKQKKEAMDSGHWFEVGQQVVLAAEEYDWKTEVTGARNGDTATVVGRDDDTNAYNVRNSEWAKKPGASGDFPSGVITVGGWALKALPAETGD